VASLLYMLRGGGYRRLQTNNIEEGVTRKCREVGNTEGWWEIRVAREWGANDVGVVKEACVSTEKRFPRRSSPLVEQ